MSKMVSITILQLVCMCVVPVLVTCDRDITHETLSSLQHQVQTLQTAFQSQLDQQDRRIGHLANRIQELEAENQELKHRSKLSTTVQQKRVAGDGAAFNSVGFSASLSTTTALGNAQIVVFDTVISNDGNGYDTRHGHFTAPTTGLYAFSVTVMCYGSESEVHVAIVKDGQKIDEAFANGNHYDNGSKLVVVQLEAGQMVWVEHMVDPSGNKIHGDGYSSFSGFLIQGY